MKSLQNQYNLIKEGKGNKEIFLKEAKAQFPQYITNVQTFDQVIHSLTEKGIINENITLVSSNNPVGKDWFKIFNENVAANLKDTDKDVVELETKGYDYKAKNNNNISTAEMLTGYYLEMKDPKNAEKTEDEIKAIVVKNLEKDPLFYVKDGQFGVKGLGYKSEHPGLPKDIYGNYALGIEPKVKLTGKYKSSGMEPVKLNESKHSAEADLKIYKSELNLINKVKAKGEKHEKRKAELEKKIADLESKMNEGMFGDSDGDYEHLEEGNLNAKYKPSEEYKYAVEAKHVVGLQGKEDTLYFKSEKEAKDYASDKPGMRKYKGVVGKSLKEAEEEMYVVYTYPYGEEDKKTLHSKNLTLRDAKRAVVNLGIMHREDSDMYGHMPQSEWEATHGPLTEAKKRAIEKHIAEIEKMGEVAAWDHRIGKIQEKIEELTNKMTVTEGDDVKDMVDKKAVKELKKDIALLEKKKALYEKQKAKAAKKVSDKSAMQTAAGKDVTVMEEKEEEKPFTPPADPDGDMIRRAFKRDTAPKPKKESWSGMVRELINKKNLKLK